MEKWGNAQETIIDFEVHEVKYLTKKLAHLFEGNFFIKGTEQEVEDIIFSTYPELNDGTLYLAQAHNLTSSFHFHPIVTEKIENVKYLYHLTRDLNTVLKEGLKGFSRSQDGIRFLNNRVYFSLISFSEIEVIENLKYMNNREEIRIEVTPDMEIFSDPEYLKTHRMVYVPIDYIPTELITATGYKLSVNENQIAR